MVISAGFFGVVRPATLAMALIVTAGCAAAPPQAASSAPATGAQAPAYVEDETPASQTDLVASADFAINAQRQGFRPEVRNGAVVYCWTDQDIGSRLPTKKCVNQAQAQILIQQRQAQRDAVQRMTSGPCTQGLNCTH